METAAAQKSWHSARQSSETAASSLSQGSERQGSVAILTQARVSMNAQNAQGAGEAGAACFLSVVSRSVMVLRQRGGYPVRCREDQKRSPGQPDRPSWKLRYGGAAA